MRFGIYSLDDFDVAGKTVLCRVDMNQPVDRKTDTLKSIQRITACAPTIRELSDKGAKVVVLAHQGSDIEYKNFYNTRPHAKVLTELLGREVKWVEDVCGPTAREAIRALKDGEILLLDNVRFCSEEQTLFEMKLQLSHEDQAKTQVVTKLAPLADLYVCDAFAAAHRDQPTLCGFEQVLPSAMGRLFEREYCVVSELMEAPEHPCTFVLGGSKISDAFMMMETVLSSGAADRVLTGGLVGQILLASQGIEIGSGTLGFINKSGYGEFIEKARGFYSKYADKIMLPVDLSQVVDGKRAEAKVGEIPADFNAMDIGSETAKAYRDVILASKTVFANGPVGVFEEAESELGTKVLFESMAETQAYTVVGGGDSVTAAKKYGVTDKLGYICTGGGALIRFLTGEELPVVKALRHAAKAFPVDK
ncbi:MAG: phosphoglycerate kinase [Clostridia bacterium]|nr:phosphoglycerate kinase [Clostridia bacterium]